MDHLENPRAAVPARHESTGLCHASGCLHLRFGALPEYRFGLGEVPGSRQSHKP